MKNRKSVSRGDAEYNADYFEKCVLKFVFGKFRNFIFRNIT